MFRTLALFVAFLFPLVAAQSDPIRIGFPDQSAVVPAKAGTPFGEVRKGSLAAATI
jgi:hypothetical protein